MPACTGAKGENAGVDCKKSKGKKGCPRNVLPKLNEGEEANCRVLPLCADGGSGACFTSLAQSSLIELSKEEKKEFTYPKANAAFVLPELPECTGMNGTRKGPGTDCRQIGRYTETGNWFVQLAKEDGEDKGPNYKKLTAGTPELPECTGMNGPRKTTSDFEGGSATSDVQCR